MLPIQGDAALVLAVIFGAVFGMLLHRGRVTDYNVIVNQFLFRDFTVIKVMLTAVIVGGAGVWLLNQAGLAEYHIKPADLAGVIAGSALFGIGMAIYGYCPGTGVAAIGQGSVHALVGAAGMIVGGILYALSFGWLKANVLSIASYGKARLPDVTGVPDWIWFAVLAIAAIVLFRLIERHAPPASGRA